MRGREEVFVSIEKAVELIADEAALAPDTVRAAVIAAALAGEIRLRDTSMRVLRYADTPEGAHEEAARLRRREENRQTARYNPNVFAASRRAPIAPARRPAASSNDWLARYTLKLIDLEKAIGRELGVSLDLSSGASAASEKLSMMAGGQTQSATARLLKFFSEKSKTEAFDGLAADRWKVEAARAGISFGKTEFEEALAVAGRLGLVRRPKGPPKAEKRLGVIEHKQRKAAELNGTGQKTPGAGGKQVGGT